MSVNISDNSRLKFHTLREIDGIEFWAGSKFPAIESEATDLVHQLKDYERIDNIAYKHYTDENAYWVIAKNNGMEDFPKDLRRWKVFSTKSGVEYVAHFKRLVQAIAYKAFIEDDLGHGNISVERDLVTLKIPTKKRVFSDIYG